MPVSLSHETLAGLPPAERTMILFEAAGSGNTELLAGVLAFADTNPNALDPHHVNRFGRGTRALHLACGKSGSVHPGAVAMLLAAGADPSQEDHTDTLPLHLAAFASGPEGEEAIGLLLAAHARQAGARDPLERRSTLADFGSPLRHAVRNGTAAAARCLIEAGANPNESFGAPLLHAAIERDRPFGVIEVLVRAGSDLGAVDASGATALGLARERNRSDVVALLQAAALNTALPLPETLGSTSFRL